MSAGVNLLTQVDNGSFATQVTWFGLTQDFQGYRHQGQNRNSGHYSWRTIVNPTTETTYNFTKTGNNCDTWAFNWVAIKLG